MIGFRNWRPLVCIILTTFSTASQGVAQLLPDALVGGQVQAAFANNGGSWCYVRQGASEFQRNGASPVAVISFPELLYFDGAYHPLDGQSRLTFTSPTSGTIKFKLWGGGALASFSGYTLVFNGQQYLVNFLITFPNGCSLPIFAGYENP